MVPCDGTWPSGHREDRAHEVDMAVKLGLSDGSALVLSWAMDGLNEGLAIMFRGVGESDADSPGEPINVTNHIDWLEFVGLSIVDITPAWHIPNEGCPEMPWSFRLGFNTGVSLVVALGTAKGAGFAYSPDDLIVIFDEHLALSYKIPASATSSYG